MPISQATLKKLLKKINYAGSALNLASGLVLSADSIMKIVDSNQASYNQTMMHTDYLSILISNITISDMTSSNSTLPSSMETAKSSVGLSACTAAMLIAIAASMLLQVKNYVQVVRKADELKLAEERPITSDHKNKIILENLIPLAVNLLLNLLAIGSVGLYVGLGAASISDQASGASVHANQMELGSGISGLIAISLLTIAESSTLVARMTFKEPEDYLPTNTQNPPAPGV